MGETYTPDRYVEQRFRENYFDCEICGFPWPYSTLREQDGRDVSTLCCFEPGGGETDRDIDRAEAAALAAELDEKNIAPESEGRIGDEGESGVTEIIPDRPIQLLRGGAAVNVTLTGWGFSAADVIGYTDPGITNAVPPVLVGTTRYDLSLQAALAMARGDYDLTFNGTPFRACFRVR